MSAFEELGVMPELIRAVSDLGWTLPTPVQTEAIPLILGGGDVMVASETGSGKTGAFALPVLQVVHEALRARQRAAAITSAAALASGAALDGQQGIAAAAAAGEARPVELSLDDRDALLSIRGGTRCQLQGGGAVWGGARATVGAFSGRVYYEATRPHGGGLCRVGWSLPSASLALGTDRFGYGYGSSGFLVSNNKFESCGREMAEGDTVGCALDAESGLVTFTLNGEALGAQLRVPEAERGKALFPAVCLKDAELHLNFGASPFKHAPPPGYLALAHAPPASTATLAAAVAAAEAAAMLGSGGGHCPLCLLLEPTRELAEQTHKFLADCCRWLPAPAVHCTLVVGGADPGGQQAQLRQGAHIVTGTPGRVWDFVQSGKLALGQARFFVLDEADHLAGGHKDVLKQLFGRLPKGGTGTSRLQVLLLSATLHSPSVRQLSDAMCQAPTLVDLKGTEPTAPGVDHVRLLLDPGSDASWLQLTPQVFTDGVHSLDVPAASLPALSLGDARRPEVASEAVKRLKPRLLQRLLDAFNMPQALIFCRTNFDCSNLEMFFQSLDPGGGGRESRYSCAVLGGQRAPAERTRVLQAFKEGRVRLLIATDLAARGLDISGLPYVINMNLPDTDAQYLHRVGRVGRADQLGLAISLVSSVPEKVWYSADHSKPWLRPDADNTRTQGEGGYTVWCNDLDRLKALELHLGRPLQQLSPADLSLPLSIRQRLQLQGQAYGGARSGEDGGAAREAAMHQAAIRPSVDALASLEWQAQTNFLSLAQRAWAVARS